LKKKVIGILVLLAIVIATFLVVGSPSHQPTEEKEIFNANFTSPLNSEWQANGLNNSQLDASRTPTVSGNGLVTNGSGAGYAWITLNSKFSRVKQTASFAVGTTNGAYAGLIISPITDAGPDKHPALVAGRSIHLAWGIEYLELRLYDSPTNFKSLLKYKYPPREANGTATHTVELELDSKNSNQLYVTSPDGQRHTLDHHLIPGLWGKTILVENYQPPPTFGTDRLTQIRGVTAWSGD
jgi:hypothetical protein